MAFMGQLDCESDSDPYLAAYEAFSQTHKILFFACRMPFFKNTKVLTVAMRRKAPTIFYERQSAKHRKVFKPNSNPISHPGGVTDVYIPQ